MRVWDRLRPKTGGAVARRGALLGLIALLLYGFWYEPSGLRVVEHDVALGGMLPRLRIAIIGDLHGGSPYIDHAKIERVVALANGAHPDLILLAGDYVSGGASVRMPIEEIAVRLKALHAPLGVYAVIGNHDRWSGAERVADALRANGIAVLENDAVAMRGGAFYLAGIGDFFTGASRPIPALARVPMDKPALCFTHSPDVFPLLPKRCALTVAAHTHGGQVALPLLGRLVVPSRYGQRYAAGLVQENGRTLFVTTGIGTSIMPLRLGVPPEISVLNIRE